MAKASFFGKLFLGAVTNTLHKAAEAGQADKVRKLIAKGEDANARDAHQTTPLFWAAFSQDLDVAKALVEAGADINALGPNGTTPLYNALHKKNTPLALYLIEQGANMHACDASGNTMLHLTALYASEEVAKILLEKGLDVNAISAKGFTPLSLHVLIAQSATTPTLSPDFVFFLLDAGGQYKPLPGVEFPLEEALLKLSNTILLQSSLKNYSQNAARADVREFAQKMLALSQQAEKGLEASATRAQSIQSSVLGTMTWNRHYWESSPVAVPFYNNEMVSVTYDFEPQDEPAFLAEADAAIKAFLSKNTADRLQLSPQVADFAIVNIEATDFSDYDVNDEGEWLGFRDTSIDGDWLDAFTARQKDVQDVWNMVGNPDKIMVARPKPGQPVYVAMVWECLWDIEDRFQLSFQEGKNLARVSAADGDMVD